MEMFLTKAIIASPVARWKRSQWSLVIGQRSKELFRRYLMTRD